jgi:hypothetical protein
LVSLSAQTVIVNNIEIITNDIIAEKTNPILLFIINCTPFLKH